MSFADPQSVTINAVPISLPRVSSGVSSGSFSASDGNTKLLVSHAYGKRVRRTVRLDIRKIAADPYLTSTNVPYTMSAFLVVDHPLAGFTNTELKYQVDGLTGYLTGTSGARVTQLLGGEN
jgi:hypothetical protein